MGCVMYTKCQKKEKSFWRMKEGNGNNVINSNGYKLLGRRCSRIRMACRRFWNQIWTVLGLMPSSLPSCIRSCVDGNKVCSNTWFNTWTCFAVARFLLIFFLLLSKDDNEDVDDLGDVGGDNKLQISKTAGLWCCDVCCCWWFFTIDVNADKDDVDEDATDDNDSLADDKDDVDDESSWWW